MDVTEAIKTCDFEKLYKRLVAYAYGKLKTIEAKDFNGIEPQDFVCSVIEKSLKGIRNWDSEKCSFEYFMFGCLKSDIDTFFSKKKRNADGDILDFLPDAEEGYVADVKELVLQILVDEGATDDEINMFNMWCEGLTKRSEIAIELGLEEKQVDNIRKRLVRKLINVRKLIKL